jgi:rSAM/selenodomain-associated transferase 1
MPATTATLIVFAKYPTPGKTKTRLAPLLGAEGAALLAKTMLEDLLERLAGALDPNLKCVICFDPPDSETSFKALLTSLKGSGRFTFLAQSSGTLGQRLEGALAALRRDHPGPHIFIGCDAPELSIELIDASVECAQRNEAFLAPASDGGYVLLALPENTPAEIFQNIECSSRDTARQQIEQARRLGIPTEVAETTLDDIDEPAGVLRLFERLKLNPFIAPRTLAFLNEHFESAH